jgi:hypothetical protein
MGGVQRDPQREVTTFEAELKTHGSVRVWGKDVPQLQ